MALQQNSEIFSAVSKANSDLEMSLMSYFRSVRCDTGRHNRISQAVTFEGGRSYFMKLSLTHNSSLVFGLSVKALISLQNEATDLIQSQKLL